VIVSLDDTESVNVMSTMTADINGGAVQSMYSLTFAMKLGLIRESVRVDLSAYGGRLTTEMLRDIAFAFLDRNVRRCCLDH